MSKVLSGHGRDFGVKYSNFGSDTNGHDVKAFGDTTGKYILWDASADTFYVVGTLSLDGTALTATIAEINRATDISARIVNVTAATLAVTAAAHDSKVVTINKADGCAVTLPAATGSGIKLQFIIGTTITSNSTTIKVTGNDTMTGAAIICQDGGDTVVGFETAADSDTITFNGSTTGGIKGDCVELIDIAADLWWVRITGSATGTEATPFSATVS